MAFTFPQWLHPTFIVKQPPQIAPPKDIENKTDQPTSNDQHQTKDLTPSLSYLDSYIHQWF